MKTVLRWGTRSSYGLDALMGRQVGQGPRRRTGGQDVWGTPSSGEAVGSGKVSLKDLWKEMETSREGEKAAGGQEAGTLQGQNTEVGHNGRPSWLEL